MADYNSSLPVRTQNNGDVVVEISDGTTPSQKLAVTSAGHIATNTNDGSGTAITSTTISAKQALDVNVANSITTSSGVADESTFTYGSSLQQPVGGVYNTTITQLTSGQSGALSVTSYRDLRVNLRNSSGVELGNSAADKFFVQSTDGTNSQSFTAAGEAKVDLTSAASFGSISGGTAGTFSELVGGIYNSTPLTLTNGQQSSLQLDVNGYLKVDGSGSTQPVSGTVTANQGTANTIANAWPVEITDGTNILGTSAHPVRIDPTGTTTQPVSGTVSISGTVAVTQSTSPWVDNLTQVGGSAIALGQTTMSASLPVTIASNQSAVASNITQIGGATQSATNALSTQIATNGAYVSAANPLPVTIDPAAAGTPKNYYTDSSSVAVGSTATQSTTAAGATGFYLQSILVSGSGKFKAVVSIGGTPYFAAFNSTATPSIVIPVPNNTLVATGTVVSVAMTNLDLAAQDLYSTLTGFQV